MLRWVAAGAIVVFPFPQEALEEMVPVMLRCTDRPRSETDLADATLVWLANDTGVLSVMTTDVRDFSRYRLPDGRAFEIL
jgi:predicted nucleic acid-binding protein